MTGDVALSDCGVMSSGRVAEHPATSSAASASSPGHAMVDAAVDAAEGRIHPGRFVTAMRCRDECREAGSENGSKRESGTVV